MHETSLSRQPNWRALLSGRGHLILIIFFGVGCEDEARFQLASWAEHADSSRVVPITEHPEICATCVVLTPLVVLGDAEGPGYIDNGYGVVRDSLERYWVGNRGVLKLFDSRGDFLQDVGRPGQGPMEFQIPFPLHVDRDGAIHVFDSGNLRETIIGPDLLPRLETRMPAPVHSAAPLPGEHAYVASSWMQTPESLGHPLHELRDGKVIRSFGAPSTQGKTFTPVDARRIVATDLNGNVFSAHEFRYEIEIWTPDGRPILTLEGSVLNTHEILGGPFSEENPPPARIAALQVQEPNLLWVLTWHPKPDWRSRVFEEVSPDGRIRFRVRNGDPIRSLFLSRVDIIDLDDGAIIARTEPQALLADFVGSRIAVSPEYLDDGTPQLALWQMSLQPQRY